MVRIHNSPASKDGARLSPWFIGMMSASGGLKFLILGAADPWKEHLGIWVRRGPQKNDFGAQGGSETRFGESRGHAVGGRGVMRSVNPIPDLILQNR